MLRENKLFPPLKAWLNKKGYRVYSEVCLCHKSTDVVAELDEIQIGYELKMNCSWKVISQAHDSDLFLNGAYIVIPTKPTRNKIENCINLGIGIIQIKNDTVIEILKPKLHEPVFKKKFDFEHWEEGIDAGVPCMKGIGPQQQCLASIKKYLEKHPEAKWPEIFANVHNHYASYRSLQNSMRIWRGFRLSDWKPRPAGGGKDE